MISALGFTVSIVQVWVAGLESVPVTFFARTWKVWEVPVTAPLPPRPA